MLHPIFILANQKEQYRGKCKLSKDKLLTDGRTYTVAPVNNLCELSSDLEARSSCEKK